MGKGIGGNRSLFLTKISIPSAPCGWEQNYLNLFPAYYSPQHWRFDCVKPKLEGLRPAYDIEVYLKGQLNWNGSCIYSLRKCVTFKFRLRDDWVSFCWLVNTLQYDIHLTLRYRNTTAFTRVTECMSSITGFWSKTCLFNVGNSEVASSSLITFIDKTVIMLGVLETVFLKIISLLNISSAFRTILKTLLDGSISAPLLFSLMREANMESRESAGKLARASRQVIQVICLAL